MKQKAIILPFFERFESEQFGACYRKMLFLYFSSPFYTVYRMENDRKVLDNFQACAEMKHGTSSWYAIGRLSSGSCTPSLAKEIIEMIHHAFGKGLFQLANFLSAGPPIHH